MELDFHYTRWVHSCSRGRLPPNEEFHAGLTWSKQMQDGTCIIDLRRTNFDVGRLEQGRTTKRKWTTGSQSHTPLLIRTCLPSSVSLHPTSTHPFLPSPNNRHIPGNLSGSVQIVKPPSNPNSRRQYPSAKASRRGKIPSPRCEVSTAAREMWKVGEGSSGCWRREARRKPWIGLLLLGGVWGEVGSEEE